MPTVAGKQPEIGPTSKTVAANVKRLRDAQGMNYKQLSETLESRANWSINSVGIRRIEDCERRVTVDDLMALAVALGVSPATLLYPNTEDAISELEITGLPNPENPRVIWEWLSASMWAYWLPERVGGFTKPSDFFRRAWPQWLVADLDKSQVGANGQPIGSGLDGYDMMWERARQEARERVARDAQRVSSGDD
jgi:transcriptional regulator with XRE-family HTH domain